MRRVLFPILIVVLVAACAPQRNASTDYYRFYDIDESGYFLNSVGNYVDREVSETLEFQAAYDDVYYQAMRIARSMTMQQQPEAQPTLDNWYPENWYLADENPNLGDILVTQSISICVQDRSDQCLPYQDSVKISVREDAEAGMRKVYIQSSDWGESSRELAFVNYYMDRLREVLN